MYNEMVQSKSEEDEEGQERERYPGLSLHEMSLEE